MEDAHSVAATGGDTEVSALVITILVTSDGMLYFIWWQHVYL